MANKQVSALSTLSGVASDDLIPIFDSSEAGDEKLKKYTVQELKTDLTSMDPSAFGNWVPYNEQTFTNSAIAGSWSIGTGTYKSVLEVETSGNTANLQLYYGFNTDWTATNYDGDGVPDSNNPHLIETGVVREAIFRVETLIDTTHGTLKHYIVVVDGNGNISQRQVVQYYSNTVNSVAISMYNGAGILGNATFKIYKWQEVKPIELHSYELVKEYNLDNETLSDTFDWDGEADPDCLIMANIGSSTTSSVKLQINGDTGNNYAFGGIYQDGSSVLAHYNATTNAIYLGTGTANRSGSTKLELYLKNDGFNRVCRRNDAMNYPDDAEYISSSYGFKWSNNTDDVISLSLTSAGSLTGNIRVYKLAKAHLFNQTIYNAITLNVATTGSDTTGDGTTQKPFASINGALAWCKNKTTNDGITITIQLADGTYNDVATVYTTGLNSNIRIMGNLSTPANVTLNFVSNAEGIIITRTPYMYIEGLKLVGYDPAQWKAGFGSQWGSNVYAKNCVVDNFGAGLQTYHNGFLNINSCVTNGNQYGCHAGRHGTIHIENSTLSNNSNTAFTAEQLGKISYTNCTITGNGQTSFTANGGTVTAF